MRRWVGLAVVATLGAAAAGCMGGGSQHATLSAKDALAQARKDGFVKPRLQAKPVAWRCDGRIATTGAPGTANYVTPTYFLSFEDRRVPAGPDNTGRILMGLVVFPNQAIARRCVEGAIYGTMHIPVGRYDAEGDGPFRPYNVIDPTTIETDMHAPRAPGFENRDDGTYQTWLSQGRVFALGMAYNGPHSKIVREDLQRLASEIAG